MANIYQKSWIKIAGNSKNIKERLPFHWRGVINDSDELIPILKWEVEGVVNNKNFIHGSSSDGGKNGLLAWIDIFGDITINEGVVTIALSNPEK